MLLDNGERDDTAASARENGCSSVGQGGASVIAFPQRLAGEFGDPHPRAIGSLSPPKQWQRLVEA